MEKTMTILGQDLRHGIRMLLKNPGFTALAVSTLALGIGANTAIFSVVNAVLLRPLPYLEPGRLMMVYAIYPPTGWLGGGKGPFFDPDFTEYRTQNRVFASLAAFTTPPFNLSGAGAEPERVPGAAATADFFAALGARPALGRTFTEEEDRPGRTRVVLLSDRLWRSRFSADPAVIGRTVRLDGESFTVIGVMPAGFEFPNAAELWAPLTIGVTRDNAFLRVIGRLKPGVRREQAQAEMETIARRLQQEFPKTNAGVSVSLVPLDEEVVGNVKSTLLVFMGAIGFVLLIACANVANLMLARAEVRQRETAIRAALGAGRWRLAQQFLTESLLLSGLG
ncbi:MAG: ABC transporter permease, partial [Acidobacteria bacterium]|nr:ABC transporter permease [Acidobacteriota bacterium]